MKRLVFVLFVLILTSCGEKDGYPFTYISTEDPALVVISRNETRSYYCRYTHPVQLKSITGANSFDEEPQELAVLYHWQADEPLPWEMETQGVSVVQDWERGVWVTIMPDAPYSIYHINVKPQSRDPQTIIPNQICIIRE